MDWIYSDILILHLAKAQILCFADHDVGTCYFRCTKNYREKRLWLHNHPNFIYILL